MMVINESLNHIALFRNVPEKLRNGQEYESMKRKSTIFFKLPEINSIFFSLASLDSYIFNFLGILHLTMKYTDVKYCHKY